MSNRATSAYSLRVDLRGSDFHGPSALDLLRSVAQRHVLSLTDSHVTEEGYAVGYRASDDEAALALGSRIMAAYTEELLSDYADAPAAWELQTGYGIHRRTVTPEAVTG